MVKPGRLVAGKLLGVGAAVGAILLVAYIFRKSAAGEQVLGSLTGAGKFGGQAILAPIQGLISGVAAGVGSLTQEGAKIGQNLGSFADAVAAGDFQSIIDGTFTTKYGGPGGAPSNPNPNYPPSGTTNPPGTTAPGGRALTVNLSESLGISDNRGLRQTSPTDKGSGFATNNRAHIITTIKDTTQLPKQGQITPARTVDRSTLIRGQPLNANLQNRLAQGLSVQSAIVNTAAGGIREIAGSPALLARLQQNLRSGRK